MTIVAISGGFSLIHYGHARLIKAAAEHGDVVVILNSDGWLKRKYGKVIVPYDHRSEILYQMKGVMDVLPADDMDDTVCKTLRWLKPHYFANGGDRTDKNTPELMMCEQLGIKPLFNVGGEKVESSSRMIREWVQYHDF